MDYLQYYNNQIKRVDHVVSFKPCYKWITFNTKITKTDRMMENVRVLNLVINGLPSIL